MTDFESRLEGMFDEAFASGRPLFFVQGLWRSGTSWLGRMLNDHPDVYVCPHELHSYMRMVQVSQFGQPLELNAFLSERHAAGRKAAFLSMLQHFWRAEKPIARLIGERSPGADVMRLKQDFPQSKIVIVLRDGRDICVSAAFLETKRGTDPRCIDRRTGQPPLRHVLESALTYAVYVPEYLALERAHPSDVLIVRYERLLADRDAEMTKVFSFLKADVDAAQIAAIGGAHAFSREATQLSSTEDGNFWMRKGISGDWTNHLSTAAVAAYERIAGSALEQAGYPITAGPRVPNRGPANWKALHSARRLLRDIDGSRKVPQTPTPRLLLASARATLRLVEGSIFGHRTNLRKMRGEISTALRERFAVKG